MREYDSCFVGIPLPGKTKLQFEKLLVDVHKIEPRLELTGFSPHITLLYLGGKFTSDLRDVFDLARPALPVIRGKKLNIGGYGDFADASTIFLRVLSPPPELEIIHNYLNGSFGTWESHPFCAHVTVCRDPQKILTTSTRKSLVARLDEVDWSFPITRLLVEGDNFYPQNIAPRGLVLRA